MTEVVRDDLAQNHWFGKSVPVGQIMRAFVKNERGTILNRYAILGKRADHSPRHSFIQDLFSETGGGTQNQKKKAGHQRPAFLLHRGRNQTPPQSYSAF